MRRLILILLLALASGSTLGADLPLLWTKDRPALEETGSLEAVLWRVDSSQPRIWLEFQRQGGICSTTVPPELRTAGVEAILEWVGEEPPDFLEIPWEIGGRDEARQVYLLRRLAVGLPPGCRLLVRATGLPPEGEQAEILTAYTAGLVLQPAQAEPRDWERFRLPLLREGSLEVPTPRQFLKELHSGWSCLPNRVIGWDPAKLREYLRPGCQVSSGEGWSWAPSVAESMQHLEIFDQELQRLVLFYWSSDPIGTAPVLTFHSPNVGRPELVDLRRAGSGPERLRYGRDEKRGRTLIRDLPVEAEPLALVLPLRLPAEGRPDAPLESTGVQGTWLPDPMVLLQRLQSQESLDAEALTSWIGRGDVRVDIRIPALGMSFDLLFESIFLWKRGEPLEWVLEATYLDGVRQPSLDDVEIPMVQPEKVLALPLEIHLDREYDYRLRGVEEIQGRSCYRLEFQPLQPDSGRHAGTVWIDRVSFRRIRQRVTQSGLTPPLESHVQVQEFGPVGPGWIVQASRSDLVSRTAGRSTVIEQSLRLEELEADPPDFEERRERHRAREVQMKVDSPKGFVDYQRGRDGTRVPRRSPAQVPAAMMGVMGHSGSGQLIPLAGINYFDFDLFGTGFQGNILFGGVILVGSAYRPGLAGGCLEPGVDLALWAIPQSTSVRSLGQNRQGETLDRISQSGAASLTLRVGERGHLKGTYGLEYWNFQRNGDTASDFRTPSDTFVHRLRGEAEFNRAGLTLQAWLEGLRRDRWQRWGLPGGEGDRPEEHRDGWRTGLEGTYDHGVGRFQRLTLGAGYRTGGNLDRFSRHRFNLFNDSFAGYGSADFGVQELAYVRAGWRWRAGPFHLSLKGDLAWGRSGSLGPRWEPYPGLGVGAGTIGPWGTMIQLEGSYGFRSLDEEGREGTWGGQIRILRMLDML